MGDCAYCEIAKGSTNAIEIYSDPTLMVIHAPKPAVVGHVQIIPKIETENINDFDDLAFENLMLYANKVSIIVFETLGIEGTNIILNNGGAAQKYPHIIVDVIPRKSGDSVNLKWDPKQIAKPEMEEITKKIKDEVDIIQYNLKNKTENAKSEIKSEIKKEEIKTETKIDTTKSSGKNEVVAEFKDKKTETGKDDKTKVEEKKTEDKPKKEEDEFKLDDTLSAELSYLKRVP